MVLSTLAGIGSAVRGVRTTDISPTTGVLADTLELVDFARMRDRYRNSAYIDPLRWDSYRETHRLPAGLRAIFNPTARAVDYFASKLYGGPWTDDGKPLPDGTQHAIPFPADVIEDKPELLLAALQLLNWGNWNAKRHLYVREGAMTGSVFVELVDVPDERRVYPRIWPVEYVTGLTLDAMGNVKAYALEFTTSDGSTANYRYRRVVDGEAIREFRDQTMIREDPNPYTFVPGVWVRHRDNGGIYGDCAISGVENKIDELNRIATSAHNYIGLLQGQPVVFWSEQPPGAIGADAAVVGTGEYDTSGRRRQGNGAADGVVRWLWGKTRDGNRGYVENMMQAVPLDGPGERITALLDEIKADLPEITIDEVVRDLPDASGPIIDRMLPTARGRLAEAESNYDAGTVKIIQMGVAIAGWRLATGAWGRRSQLTRQHAKFDDWGLDNWAKGDMDLSILPRPLVPTTEQERIMALQLRKEVGGYSDAWAQRQLGDDDTAIAQNEREQQAQTDRFSIGIA